MICKQLESHNSHGGQQLATLEEASKPAEWAAHHQAAEHREGCVDVPVPRPPTVPVLQVEQKGRFHTNWDILGRHQIAGVARLALQDISAALLRSNILAESRMGGLRSRTPPQRSPTGDYNPIPSPRQDPELRCPVHCCPLHPHLWQPSQRALLNPRHRALQAGVEASEPHRGLTWPRTVGMKLLVASGGPQNKCLGTSLGLL